MPLRKSARVIVAALALSLCAGTAASAAPGAEPPPPPSGSTVTLITGDRVDTTSDGNGTIRPAPGRENIHFSTYREDGHLVVIPSDAAALVAAGTLDKRVFDVTTLRESGYDDASAEQLPLIVGQADGQSWSAPTGSTVTQALPSINGSGISTAKSELDSLWNSVTAETGGSRVLSGGVERIWLDGVRSANLDRSASQVGAPQAWETGINGKGTTVAVLDTGVDQTHPDLADRETGQRNFSGAPSNEDHFGHGTHVAGIVAGTGAFTNGKYRGIAHGANVLDGKVLNDSGSGKESWIIAGMQWAAEQKADVANLSLGGGDTPEIDPLEEAVNSLSAKTDTLFVVSAGNSGPSEETIGSPGSADAALTVGAVNREDGLAPFSSRGPRIGDGAVKPDITAPGTDIVSALHSDGTIGKPIDGRYTALDGTSMAAPHVAGAAALLAQARPNLTGEQLKAALTGSALPNPDLTAFEQGSGRLDVPAALALPVISEPSSLGFGTQLWPHHDDKPTVKPLTYRNTSDKEVTLDVAVQATAPDGSPAPEGMFSVDTPRVTIPAGGTAEVRVTSDTRVGGPDGSYSGAVVATVGKARVVTPLGLGKEVESYDVTVNQVGPDGKPTGEATTGLASGVDGESISVPQGEPTQKLRVPKGEYRVQSVLSTGGQQNPHSYVLLQPVLTVDGPKTVDLDFRATKPTSITPPDPNAKPKLAYVGFDLHGVYSLTVVAPKPDELSTAQIGPGLPPGVLTGQVGANFAADNGTYHLGWFQPDALPTGFHREVGPKDVATVRVQHGTPNGGRRGSSMAFASPANGRPVSALSSSNDLKLPGQATVFVNTDGVKWTHGLYQFTQDGQGIERSLMSPPRTWEAGKEYGVRMNYAPFAPGSPASASGNGWSIRAGDQIAVGQPLFTDGDGNADASALPTGRTSLHLGDELIGTAPSPGKGTFTVPPEAGTYRLSTVANQPGPLSTHIAASWTFTSARTDAPEPLPVNAVRFHPELDDDNNAPAGTHQEVPLFLQGANGAPIPSSGLAVQVSYDEGLTWVEAPVIDGGKVALDYPRDATSVSLRASASDEQGNTVEQTVIRAYKLKR